MEIKKEETIVSVIVPIYNVEQYLQQCIDSIVNQTYQNLDIVLVDDGSKDKSAPICDAYAKKDVRVQVIHKANGGLISAWKTGVENAKGKYLVFIDSDDWLDLDMVEQLLSYTDGSCKEMICSNYIIEKEKDKIPIKQKMSPGVYNREQIESVLFPELLGNETRMIHASRCMKLISKELIFDNMHFCNPKVTMAEDLTIIFPAILDAERIVIVEDGYYYHYRFVSESMAHHYDVNLFQKIELLCETMKKTIHNKRVDNLQDFWLQNWNKEYFFLLLLVIKNELRGPNNNCVKRIREIIAKCNKNMNLSQVEIIINSPNNRLLYEIIMHPSFWRIMSGKFIVCVFDFWQKMKNKAF